MIVKVDDESGFCFGATRAILKAEKQMENGKLYSIGDVVHNKFEMSRLEQNGLEIISHEQLSSLSNQTVYIRAHGEPPSTFEKCKENNITVVDATCPVVYALQQQVIVAMNIIKPNNGQVVITGKKEHPEVIGLNGQIDNEGIVIECKDDLEKIDFGRAVYLISQTTESLELFVELSQEITNRFKLSADMLTIKDTICRNVSNRGQHLTNFVKKYDLILFVTGNKSSNGMVLYKICKKNNPNCYKIEYEGNIDNNWFDGVNSVGICGATSTPKWLMVQVARFVENFVK